MSVRNSFSIFVTILKYKFYGSHYYVPDGKMKLNR